MFLLLQREAEKVSLYGQPLRVYWSMLHMSPVLEA